MKILSLLSFLVLCLSACSPRKGHFSSPPLVVSIEPVRFLTEQIAGSRFQVVTLVPNGSNPESYEPTPQQLIKLNDCKAYLLTGELGFEKTRLDNLKQNAPQLPVYNLSDGIEWIKGADRSNDPHIWMSPRNALVMARNICRYLCLIDSSGAKQYRANLSRFAERTDSLDHAVRRELRPLRSRSFFILHPALAYFARDYGLKQVCINEEDKEPSANAVQRLIARGRNERIKVFFVQKEFSGHSSTLIADETGAKMEYINPLSYHWMEEISRTAQLLCHE